MPKSRAKLGTTSLGVLECFNVIRHGTTGLFKHLQERTEGEPTTQKKQCKQSFTHYMETVNSIGCGFEFM
jgi:hypothetical protein